MNRRMLLALACGLVLSGSGAFAQRGGTPARLRGKIEAISGDTLQLTLRNGTKASATLQPNTRVTWLTVAQPNDIQKGSYVGTAAVPQADGTLRALEVQVFPPSMRGVGEGTRPWDLGAQGSMTNGTIGSLIASNGRTITITYKGGEKRVVVPDDVPIVTYEPADRTALTPGANLLINGTRGPDGTVTARSISVGKNGLVPPM
jgi:Domain of unknown function (DUF5666)